MPNKATHTIVGTVAGGCTAAYRAREQEATKALEIIGGCVGGYIGSRLPDIIEPACWPGHRQFAHSVAVGGGVAYGLYKLIEEWEIYFRSRAEYYKNMKSEDLYWLKKLFYQVLEILSHIAAGTLSGFSVGYLSHLFTDGCTQKGLPLIQ